MKARTSFLAGDSYVANGSVYNQKDRSGNDPVSERRFKLSSFVLLLVLMALSGQVSAQCPYDNTFHTVDFDASTLSVGNRTLITNTVWASEYVEITNMVAGASYTIDLCGSDDLNTQLTIYPAGGGVPLGTADDVCGDDAELDFIPPATGTYHMLNDFGPSCGNAFVNCSMYITLNSSICTDPTVPTLTHTPSTVCVGGTASLNISGTLNDATAWQVYTGSCGGTNIGSTTTGTFAIPGTINTPTTYFVRGEGGCVTPGSCGTVTITPQALDDASFSYGASSYCTNDPDPTPTITGLGGGTFSSTAGLFINTSTGVIDVSASTPNTYTVTYTTAGTCPNSSNVSVTIESVVTGTFNAPADLCSDAGVQSGLGLGTPSGGIYSGPGVTDDGNGSTYSFDPAAAGVGVHTITYTPAGSCSTPATDQVEVFAAPTVTFTAPADLCVDAGVQSGLGSGMPTMGVYSGPGVTDDGNGTTYSFDPAAAGVGVHTITYSYTNTNGCSGTATDQVEVFALPTVTFTAPADLCVDAGVQSGLGSGMPTMGVYSGAGVTDDGNGTTYSFDPAAAGVGVHTITYSYTNANGCSGTATDQVEVFAAPTVTFTAPADLCVDAGVQSGLGSGMPTLGVYSGAGVTDDGNGTTYSFDPAAAGVGVHTITYSYTNANGCSGTATDQVEVFGLPSVTFTGPGTFCTADGVQSGLGSGTPAMGVYSGPGVTDDGNGSTYSFDPAATGAGTFTITYTYTNANGCTGTASDIVTVSAGSITAVCQDITINLDANGEATITASDIDGGSSVSCGTLNLSASQTLFTCADLTVGGSPTNDMVISGVYDVSLPGGVPKGVELYVINDIPDLSDYALGSANNGGGSDGIEFTFPAVAATAGQFIYVSSEATDFTNFFGFAPDYTDIALGVNGDDAIELFFQGGVIDIFGDINVDGTGEAWEYQDGWAYRMTNTGNDGSAWTPSNWMYSGINVLDGETSNATAAVPVPIGTYSMTVATPNTVTLTVSDGSGGSATCTANVTVLDVTDPVVNCQDLTAYLDGSGNATITPQDVTNTGTIFFTSFNGEIYSFPKSGTEAPSVLYSNVSNDLPVGIEYIPETDEIMWANGLAIENTIASADGLGTPTILPNSQVGVGFAAHDQAVDFANGRYFFSVNQSGVYVANLDGTGSETLINGVVDGLNTVEYDAANQRIFTNSVQGNQILSMDDTGAGLVTLFDDTDGVSGPRDIAYDAALDVIYWTNRGSGEIMVGNADGTGTPTVLYSGLTGLYELELDPNYDMLYWVEAGPSDDIMYAPKDGSGTPMTRASGDFGEIRGISLFNLANTDNCDIVSETIDISSFDCADAGNTVTVTLTATDASGNSANCTSQVTILDTISPTITCPADIVQDQGAGVCSADIAVPTITTSDNCAGETIAWTITQPSGATSGTGQIGMQTMEIGVSTIDLTVTDASGNTSSCSFTVTVNDTVVPATPALSDLTDPCSVTAVAPTTTDNCGGTITGTTTDPLTYTTQGTFVINWTFDDGNGNITTASQNVIITDATPPTASNIDTVFAECIGDVAIDITLVDDEADNCGTPVVTYVGDVASNGTGCNDTIVRTYNVADAAGNNIDVTQIIILNDVTPPTVPAQGSITVQCMANFPAPNVAQVAGESDNCGSTTVTWVSDVSDGQSCPETFTRTYNVSDNCGNSVDVTQLILVHDVTDPVPNASSLPTVTQECGVPVTPPTASDNCDGTIDGTPDVAWPITTLGTTTVTWTFSDACGNSVTQTQDIVVTGIDVSTWMAGDGITIVASNGDPGVTYQWIDCGNNNAPLAGETNQNFTPTFSSDFAVIVTQNGCTDTSDCVTITEVGLDELISADFELYPNPTSGQFTVRFDGNIKAVELVDVTGRIVLTESNLSEGLVDASTVAPGKYMVRLTTESGDAMTKPIVIGQ